jgi:hypothetical protein
MAVFGDFIVPAGEHIAAAVSIPGDIPDQARCGIIQQLNRLVATLARYLADIAPPHCLDFPDGLSPPMLATARARNALRRAAKVLGEGARALEGTNADASHPAVRHLSAAADHLAAGRDLLQSHFVEGPFGGWEGGWYWASALSSEPVTEALTGTLADCARRIAPWAARLSVTGTVDGVVPSAASLGLHAATRWLWVAGASVEAAQRQHPPSAAAQRLLAAIPPNFPSPRHPPAMGETIPELCKQTAHTSERLRQLTWSFTRQARWSPAASSQFWRRNAFASAIVGHSAESVLRMLVRRANQLGMASDVRAQLHGAAAAVQHSWRVRRDLASEWDILSTGTRRDGSISPVAADLGDLVLRTGRIAYQDSQWSPASGAGVLRGPASLAPSHDDIGAVLAAVHHAMDAVARLLVEDYAAVCAAIADRRLYLPTRLMPAEYDIPRRYTPAPRERTDATLTGYENAINVDVRAVASLEQLAETLHTPSELLAVAHRMSRHPPWTGGLPDVRRRPTAAATARGHPGMRRAEQVAWERAGLAGPGR